MIVLDSQHLLMVEPTSPRSATPVIDGLTRKMAAALATARIGNHYRGQHSCTGHGCRSASDNADHHVGEALTNSLAVHYLAYHREDVPAEELLKVAALAGDEVEPTTAQIEGGVSLW